MEINTDYLEVDKIPNTAKMGEKFKIPHGCTECGGDLFNCVGVAVFCSKSRVVGFRGNCKNYFLAG